jgi:hypothetical protein
MNARIRLTLAAAWLCAASGLLAQGPTGSPPGPPRPPRAVAPVDLTGYWVSVIAEDWRWRMVTPLKGDSSSIPVTPEGRRVTDAWDPEKDQAAGLQCKAYGAAGVMRLPGRVRITWQDDSTLKLETDAGTQTRLLRFGATPPAGEKPSWQGFSVASWERPPATPGAPPTLPIFATRIGTRGRSLEVTTTHLRPGYLRKNGVPYGDKVSLTEYFDYFKQPNGDEWFTVTTIVRDPQYLIGPFITSSDFKKEPDGSKWRPTPCTAR